MAEKTAVFSLKVDTGNSVQDIQSFDKAVEELNKDLKDTSKIATEASNQGMETFDQKLAELNQRLEDGGLTMREMTKLMKEYQNLAARAGAETPIGQQAITNAAGLKDEIGDLKAQTTALSSDFVGLDTALAGVETGAAAFQGLQSAIALTGVENEDLIKTMAKLQAIQGVVNAVSIVANNLNKEAILGIQLRNALEKIGNFVRTGTIAGLGAQAAAQTGVTVATASTTVAMKFLRAALIATGIGAVVVLLGLAAEAMGLFGDETESAEDKQKKLDKQIEQTNERLSSQSRLIDDVSDIIEGRTQQEINSAKRRGASEEELTKITKEGLIDRLDFLKQEEEAATKFFLKKTKDLRASNKEIDAAEESYLKISKTRRDLQRKIDSEDADREYKSIQDRVKRQKDAAEKRLKAQQDEAKRLAELAKKANEDRIKAEDEQFQLSLDLMKAGQEKELFELSITYDEKYRMAHDNALLQYQLRAQENADRMAIIDKYNKIELDKIAEQEARKKSLRDQITRFMNNERENELLDLEEWYKKQEELNLAAFKSDAIDEEEYYDAQLKAQDEYRKKRAEINKKYDAEDKANEVKAREESLKKVTEAIDSTQKGLDELKKINAFINEVDQARLNSIAKNRDEDLANLDKNLQAQLSQEGLTADQKKQIEENFAKQKYQVQLQAYEQEEKIKKAQFNRDKALKLAQVAIDTASAIVKGIAQFGPPPSPAGIAAIASASLIGITQAMAIMNQKYQAGSAPTAPQLSNGGGGAAGAGASSFTANTNTQQTDLTTLGLGQGNNIPVSQVVVLESDITGTQNKVQLQEAKTTF
jgi:predicted  nucleic acid-binding Zn-ribbon protein